MIVTETVLASRGNARGKKKNTGSNSCSNMVGTIKKISDKKGWRRNGERVWVETRFGAAIVENRMRSLQSKQGLNDHMARQCLRMYPQGKGLHYRLTSPFLILCSTISKQRHGNNVSFAGRLHKELAFACSRILGCLYKGNSAFRKSLRKLRELML